MAFYDEVSDTTNFVISFTSTPQQDFSTFAKGYANAAVTLATHLLERPARFADYEAYPIVFLYRQAFELYLKGFLYQTVVLLSFQEETLEFSKKVLYKHRLVPLAKAFQRICAALPSSKKDLLKIAEKVLRFAAEFERIDKDSYSYRYPINTQGASSTKRHQIINLRALHNSMQQFLAELAAIDFGLAVASANAQEIYEIMQESVEAMMAFEENNTVR